MKTGCALMTCRICGTAGICQDCTERESSRRTNRMNEKTDPINTSDFDQYYYDDVGGWIKQSAQTQRDTQYDDGPGVLVTPLTGEKLDAFGRQFDLERLDAETDQDFRARIIEAQLLARI